MLGKLRIVSVQCCQCREEMCKGTRFALGSQEMAQSHSGGLMGF